MSDGIRQRQSGRWQIRFRLAGKSYYLAIPLAESEYEARLAYYLYRSYVYLKEGYVINDYDRCYTDMDELMSVEEVAKLLKSDVKTIELYIKDTKNKAGNFFPDDIYVWFGKRPLFFRDKLMDWIKGGCKFNRTVISSQSKEDKARLEKERQDFEDDMDRKAYMETSIFGILNPPKEVTSPYQVSDEEIMAFLWRKENRMLTKEMARERLLEMKRAKYDNRKNAVKYSPVHIPDEETIKAYMMDNGLARDKALKALIKKQIEPQWVDGTCIQKGEVEVTVDEVVDEFLISGSDWKACRKRLYARKWSHLHKDKRKKKSGGRKKPKTKPDSQQSLPLDN